MVAPPSSPQRRRSKKAHFFPLSPICRTLILGPRRRRDGDGTLVEAAPLQPSRCCVLPVYLQERKKKEVILCLGSSLAREREKRAMRNGEEDRCPG
ncbi:hypothetical protein VIGAN_01146800, partial [Vigna angularis var. angularis]